MSDDFQMRRTLKSLDALGVRIDTLLRELGTAYAALRVIVREARLRDEADDEAPRVISYAALVQARDALPPPHPPFTWDTPHIDTPEMLAPDSRGSVDGLTVFIRCRNGHVIHLKTPRLDRESLDDLRLTVTCPGCTGTGALCPC